MLRYGLILVAGLGLSGCYIPASTKLVHPETRDVRYCWQHTVLAPMSPADHLVQNQTGAYQRMLDTQKPDAVCLAKWTEQGYVVERPPEVVQVPRGSN